VTADEVIISGQKVWSSGAQAANMSSALPHRPGRAEAQGHQLRPDPDVPGEGSSNGFDSGPSSR